ncbi:MAG: carbon starvation protein A [Planctomycetota bacterium]|nr:MAG: carbon starvation protein A [Planctomycetota bacterium]
MWDALSFALLSMVGFLAAYFVYGRFIGRKILCLDPERSTPAQLREDGVEYVPTNRFILFGHHFASIAGLGPILGPAIAVIWGWLPALLWVFFGTIFLGAVHDFTVLGVSLRSQGKSITEVSKEVVGERARALFMLIIFFTLALAMGVFVIVIAVLFTDFYPSAVIPTFSLILIACFTGILVYKYRLHLALATGIGLVLMLFSLLLGVRYPFSMYSYFLSSRALAKVEEEKENFSRYVYVIDFGGGRAYLQALSKDASLGERVYLRSELERINRRLEGEGKLSIVAVPFLEENVSTLLHYFRARGDEGMFRELARARESAKVAWMWILLGYALVASILPVWLLLQPRDYLNSFQLYFGCALMYLGLFLLRPKIVAPALHPQLHFFESTSVLPALFPFLFITIACGAISGFHCLVSSGTTVRQLKRETDAQLIGYGGMLMEGSLAVVVILACTAGFPSQESWHYFYRDWHSASGLGAKLAAFINGAGLFISQVGISLSFSKTLVAVVIVGFAMTTLDSATRLLRYNIEEFRHLHSRLNFLSNRYIASFLAVLAIAFFAFLKLDGRSAGLTLWALFGTTNQLLGGIALLVVSLYLYSRGLPYFYTLLPMFFMLGMTLVAMILKWREFWQKGSLPLLFVGGAILGMTFWLCVEGWRAWRRYRRKQAV